MARDHLLGMVGEGELLGLLTSARTKIAYMAPGITQPLARAIGERWEVLGPDAVRVTLDVDPEVCRMGYGTLEGLEMLHEMAERLGTTIRRQAGIRIGVLVADGAAIVFAPTPLLIEAGSSNPDHPNSVRLSVVPVELARELGFGSSDREDKDRRPLGEPIDTRSLHATREDLEKNPPLHFDVAQRLRVFNAMFEFVEFELRGGAIGRKTVPVPANLLGLARNPDAESLLRSTFKLVGDAPNFSPTKLLDLKQTIIKDFLVTIPGFGQVVLRSLKPRFERRVRAFERYITCFMSRLEKELGQAVECNRQKLIQALLPGVLASPPREWSKVLGPSPTESQLRQQLDRSLREIFERSRSDLLPNIRLVFKGVTYELLTDPRFVTAAKQAFPGVDALHEEFDAARGAGIESLAGRPEEGADNWR